MAADEGLGGVRIAPKLRGLAFALLIVLGAASGASVDYPARGIRLILPFPPGGGTDTLGRLLAQRLSETLGQSVIPENRSGAGGNVGNEFVSRAAPDGYTLLLGSPSLAISPSLYRKLNYNPATDLTPVALAAEIPTMLTVHRNVPVRSVKELIQLARSQPGKLAFGTGGAGTSNELGAHLFVSTTRVKILIVPHKGVNQATLALLGGHVDMVIAGVATVGPYIRKGKLRGLALLGPRRSPTLPDVPTSHEAGYPWLQMRAWYVLMAPAGTSRGIVDKLNIAVTHSVRSGATEARMLKLGFEPMTGTPEDAAQFIADETVRWRKVVHAAGVQVE
jgi:tripartite-type tricarboxylate transporter receptor subunit TctC